MNATHQMERTCSTLGTPLNAPPVRSSPLLALMGDTAAAEVYGAARIEVINAKLAEHGCKDIPKAAYKVSVLLEQDRTLSDEDAVWLVRGLWPHLFEGYQITGVYIPEVHTPAELKRRDRMVVWLSVGLVAVTCAVLVLASWVGG